MPILINPTIMQTMPIAKKKKPKKKAADNWDGMAIPPLIELRNIIPN